MLTKITSLLLLPIVAATTFAPEAQARGRRSSGGRAKVSSPKATRTTATPKTTTKTTATPKTTKTVTTKAVKVKAGKVVTVNKKVTVKKPKNTPKKVTKTPAKKVNADRWVSRPCPIGANTDRRGNLCGERSAYDRGPTTDYDSNR